MLKSKFRYYTVTPLMIAVFLMIALVMSSQAQTTPAQPTPTPLPTPTPTSSPTPTAMQAAPTSSPTPTATPMAPTPTPAATPSKPAEATPTTTTLAQATPNQKTPARGPSDTLRDFYKALFEKRFREALSMSIYLPAIEGLTAKEFDEFRPDFEAMSKDADGLEVTGEQISGDIATVFVKIKDDSGTLQTSKVDMIRAGDAWIVGNLADQKAVKQVGKEYFFNIRIQAHEAEAEDMMVRIVKAQVVHNSQNGGLYADMATLIKEGLLPADIETTASTGYRYHMKVSADSRSYQAGAEPAQYGRSGKLSFYLDLKGLIRKDVGGKPLTPEK